MSKRTIILLVIATLAIAVAAALWWLTRPLPVLTVTTWPGPYARAQANAMFHPFGEEARVDVREAEYDGGLEHLRDEVRTRNYDWDVIDLELADAVRACSEGLLARIDARALPAAANGVAARADFLPFANGPCWVGSAVYGQVIAYASTRLAPHPLLAQDFFDLKKFPGGRGLRRGSPKLNLELALLADGVPPENIYPLLETSAGVDRALAKLASIRDSIVWWSRAPDALGLLEDRRATMTTAFNGDVFDAQVHGRHIGVIWNDQLDELDVFGIPKGDPRRDLSLAFIEYATGTKPLARAAEWLPYGPARRSALAFVGKNPETGMRMLPYLPTAPANAATAFAVDDVWWLRHGHDIAPAWEAFLNRTR